MIPFMVTVRYQIQVKHQYLTSFTSFIHNYACDISNKFYVRLHYTDWHMPNDTLSNKQTSSLNWLSSQTQRNCRLFSSSFIRMFT